MKLLLITIACLVAVCSAIPPVPMIPETFSSSGEVEFHEAKQTRMGRCKKKPVFDDVIRANDINFFFLYSRSLS